MGISWGGGDTQNLPHAREFVWSFCTYWWQWYKNFGRAFTPKSHLCETCITFSSVNLTMLRHSVTAHDCRWSRGTWSPVHVFRCGLRSRYPAPISVEPFTPSNVWWVSHTNTDNKTLLLMWYLPLLLFAGDDVTIARCKIDVGCCTCNRLCASYACVWNLRGSSNNVEIKRQVMILLSKSQVKKCKFAFYPPTYFVKLPR